MQRSSRKIGTMQEKSLHAALKQWYAQPDDQLECDVGGFVIDIVRTDAQTGAHLLIEIQTRNLSTMKRKLLKLVEDYQVHLVHPIAQERTIVRIDRDGVIVSRRKSPRKGNPLMIFSEIVSFPTLLAHPNFTLEALLVREEQIWHDDGKGSWRRKHWSIADRRLLEVVGSVILSNPVDACALLPADLPDEFDTGDIAKLLKQPRPLAQKMAYCLREMGVIEIAGKRGKSILYRLVNRDIS